MWKIDPKDRYTKQTWYTKLYVEHVCNSETILWNSGEEGKEKRMIDSKQYQNALHGCR
jgi:hypothetical protein